MPPRIALLAAALALAACSRQEPASGPKVAPRVQAPAAGTAENDRDPGALDERLAHPQAAARHFERKVLEPPPPPRLAIPTPAAPRPAEPAPPNNLSAPGKAAPPPPIPAPPPASNEPEPLRLVTRVDPEFPREALQARVDRGQVRARVTIDARGAVRRVEILDSQPRRVFDRAVTRALSQWTFNPGADGRTLETEIAFNR